MYVMRRWPEGTRLSQALLDVMAAKNWVIGKGGLEAAAAEMHTDMARVSQYLKDRPPRVGSPMHENIRIFLDTDRDTYASLIGYSVARFPDDESN